MIEPPENIENGSKAMNKSQEEHTLAQIKALLQSQTLAALATQGVKGPYINLVAFCAAEDLTYVLFATPRTTRKFENLKQAAQTAILVNNSQNQTADFHQATAVTILGDAHELVGEERRARAGEYLARHAYLDTFVNSKSCALLKVEVEKYLLVENFQRVTEYFIK